MESDASTHCSTPTQVFSRHQNRHEGAAHNQGSGALADGQSYKTAAQKKPVAFSPFPEADEAFARTVKALRRRGVPLGKAISTARIGKIRLNKISPQKRKSLRLRQQARNLMRNERTRAMRHGTLLLPRIAWLMLQQPVADAEVSAWVQKMNSLGLLSRAAAKRGDDGD